ncbi:hypothetical protein HanXRQr2_Chr16g0776791 [Helianthus annuus]|uniref:Uncharacterized protein n=1 Tax=Helianthus annuus TaxID=4232 RepID=A0A9K3H077_HELAN|nr:hypothetical protein HanXRQr2_Chr16g0776791 [Helianthus annuus]
MCNYNKASYSWKKICCVMFITSHNRTKLIIHGEKYVMYAVPESSRALEDPVRIEKN